MFDGMPLSSDKCITMESFGTLQNSENTNEYYGIEHLKIDRWWVTDKPTVSMFHRRSSV